jgi:hypothetical protein
MSRRRIPPTSRPTPIPSFQAQNTSQNESSEPIIKHLQFVTSFSQKNEIVNEFILFIFTLIAASSQFVHLYRSVWWFPDSYTNYTVVSQRVTSFQSFFFLSIFSELLFDRRQSCGVYFRDDWSTIPILHTREDPGA